MGMERWKKIRQGNNNVAEHGACCCTNLALGSLACLVLFLFVSTFFGVERGGIGGFGVFDIHTLPPLYLRYGRYYLLHGRRLGSSSSFQLPLWTA